MDKSLNIAIIGGGAAGFFTALNIEGKHQVSIFEESSNVLKKVRISGGGRCNVTHHDFEIKSFVKNYPRGERELISPMHQFQARDTVEWFTKRGVEIKVESDGRMFPLSNTSETIVNCFLAEASKKKIVTIHKKVVSVKKVESSFKICFSDESEELFDRVLVATGSSRSGYSLVKGLGHTLTDLAPSLFTFKIKHPLLSDTAGTSFKNIELQLKIGNKKFNHSGDLLITHWGLSGPAVLKLSAWAAREFKEAAYKAELYLDFKIPSLQSFKKDQAKTLIKNARPQSLTKKFWDKLLNFLEIDGEKKWAEISKEQIKKLDDNLSNMNFQILGQNRFKEEFVECGGVDLKEINFKTMESKLVPGLFFAGEILDIDGITGGFNFQNAWTTGFIAGENITR